MRFSLLFYVFCFISLCPLSLDVKTTLLLPELLGNMSGHGNWFVLYPYQKSYLSTYADPLMTMDNVSSFVRQSNQHISLIDT